MIKEIDFVYFLGTILLSVDIIWEELRTLVCYFCGHNKFSTIGFDPNCSSFSRKKIYYRQKLTDKVVKHLLGEKERT
jgi:hypothetical protein